MLLNAKEQHRKSCKQQEESPSRCSPILSVSCFTQLSLHRVCLYTACVLLGKPRTSSPTAPLGAPWFTLVCLTTDDYWAFGSLPNFTHDTMETKTIFVPGAFI